MTNLIVNTAAGRMQLPPVYRSEKNTCAVIAITCVTNLPYDYIHGLYGKLGRRYNGRTPSEMTDDLLTDLGFSLEEWSVNGKTIRTVERELPPRGAFLISVRGHLAAHVDGVTYDWASGRLHRILSVHRVTAT